MNNALVFSPSVEYTRNRTKAGTTFAFHSTEKCPGYALTIANWSLRKVPKPLAGRQKHANQLACDTYAELVRVLGDAAFAETHRVKAELCERAKRPSGLFPSPKMALDDAKLELATALFKDILSPRVAQLSVPLFTLTMRDQSPYVIDEGPWSFSAPPRELHHLAATGFDSRLGWGILAIPPTGKDVWVVSQFSQCEVELKWNRSAAIEAEFPWLKDLAGWLARKRQRTPADYARCAKRRCMIKNAKDRREIKTYFKDLRENNYTVREAYREIARQAEGGNVGKKRLSERYVDVTPRIIRRVVETKD